MIGKTFAHYQVTAQLGAGGMGEVYRATDTKLDRSVAIKVLPPVFAADQERVVRFGREAKALAALNHPNIGAIYGLEEFGGSHFLVLELVEGETLAQRLQRGPVPCAEALQIGRQIAEALEAAHEKGVIHRDIKPGNIKITPDGKVKVLDFGLAKAFAAEPLSSLSNSPTMSIAATNAGIILGTAAYMSPEQAKGTVQVDKRTDLFSLGCVLYEMLTGRQAFQGESYTEVLAGVLAREADYSLLPPSLSPRVLNLVRRCLQKDLKKRWQGAGDLRVEIETLLSDPQGLDIRPEVSARQSPWKLFALVAAGLLVGVILGGAGAQWFRSEPAGKPVRFVHVLGGETLTRAGRRMLDLSPDGGRLAYSANQQLYVRDLSERAGRAVPGGGGDIVSPTFSPDGQGVAYYSAVDGSLKKIAVSGGVAVTLCKFDNPTGISWSAGRIIVAAGTKGVFEVAETGGEPKQLFTVGTDESAETPELLPDNKTVLFTLVPASGPDRFEKAQIAAFALDTGKRTVLMQGGAAARYMPTGHVVYAVGTVLFAALFDVKELSVIGSPVPLVEEVMRGGTNTAAAQFSFSRDGTLVYIPNTAAEGPRNVAIVDRSGSLARTLMLPPGDYDNPRVSPDGKQLLLQTSEGGGTLHVYDLSGATSLRRLTFESGNAHAIWSPDSKSVTYQSTPDGKGGIFRRLADGTGAPERLTTVGPGESQHRPRSWLKDGKTLVFSVFGKDWGIFTIPLPSDQKPAVLLDLPGSIQGQPAFSPDGRWLAYMSDESGERQIYVEAFPKTDARKYQISREPSDFPIWSPDGNEVFYYQTVANKLVSVRIQKEPFAFSDPVPLSFDMTIQSSSQNFRRFDVLPNGKQFVIIAPGNSNASRPTQEIDVVLNWSTELKQRLPVP
jgi:eukaryotic-like serine/threonine-protein kinase